VGAATSLAGVFTLTPRQWQETLEEWVGPVFTHQIPLAVAVLLGVVVAALLRRQRLVRGLEYMTPTEYGGISDVAPRRIQLRVTEILGTLGDTDPTNEHIARLVVLTGRNTLHYLDQVIERYASRARWDIRVLILNPESPEIEQLASGTREDARAGCAFLGSLQRKIAAKARPARLSWRMYTELPRVRGFLLDEDHLFFGFFVWEEIDGSARLREQNKGFVYAGPRDQLSRDCIAFFKSWFDHEWRRGEDPQE
jgi:hypothetical protein